MVSRIHHVNKKTGTYVDEATSTWDKNKKQSRNKQRCIGKLDPAQAAARDPKETATAEIIGPRIILDAVDQDLGVGELLKLCFPDYYQEIQTMAYYLVARGGPLSYCEAWSKSHAPWQTPSLTNRDITTVLRSITNTAQQNFFSKWRAKVLGYDCLCYDISIPQKLVVLFTKDSLPVYFEQQVSETLQLPKPFKKIYYVIDESCYSNVDKVANFLVSVPLSETWLQDAIDKIDNIYGPEGYRKLDNEIIYVHSQLYPWGRRRRCYLHLYYNSYAQAEYIDKFNEELLKYKEELESGALVKEHQEAYKLFFRRGKQVLYKSTAIKQYINRYVGFQALLTNGIKDPIRALQIYRDQDMVAKHFADLQNQVDVKRFRRYNSALVEGRIFLQFIALIYVCGLRKVMRSSKLIEQYTGSELLIEMESLTKIKYAGNYGHICTAMTKAQQAIIEALGLQDLVSSFWL